MPSLWVLAAAANSQDESVDRIVKYFPRAIIAVGVMLLLGSIPMFIGAIKHRDWIKRRAVVGSKSRAKQEVQLTLDDGTTLTAFNGSARLLRPGGSIKVLINPHDPNEARTMRKGVPPMVGAFMWLFMGLFLIVLGIALVAVLTALDIP